MRTRFKKAFTLVEILIVVVILGILAAIVVPQFTNATQDAQEGNLRAQIKSLQNQIELYKARNNVYPTLAEMNAAPTITGADTANHWGILIDGGYIKKAPRNPASANPTILGASHNASFGWVYDETNGDLTATYYDPTTDKLTPGNP
jgi:general secretion pathway protein G